MNIEELRDYCLQKKGATEGLPFGGDTLVFKVQGKIFALTGLDADLSVNLKCEPEKAILLREDYDFVRPGYHMNKKLWNTIDVFKTTDNNLVKGWIDDSYNLVVSSLTRKLREELEKM